jgi:general secretion pathway protein G
MTRPKHPKRLPADAGLTVLELLVVLVILSLIGTVVAVQAMGQMDRAKVDVAKLQLRQIQSGLTLFQLDNNRVPESAEGLRALLNAPDGLDGWRGPYLRGDQSIIDPWGRPVGYALADGGYQLLSLGSDGKIGGDGAAADLTLGADE